MLIDLLIWLLQNPSSRISTNVITRNEIFCCLWSSCSWHRAEKDNPRAERRTLNWEDRTKTSDDTEDNYLEWVLNRRYLSN